jgi:hypothetical protein
MNQVVETKLVLGSPGTDPEDWAREWSLVRADPNMLRDVLTHPTDTILELEHNGKTGEFIPVGNIPPAFVNTTLVLKGSEVPDLGSSGLAPLPKYAAENDEHYVNALDHFLIPYLEADRQKENGGDLLRLEGVIRIQCGWPKSGSRLAQLNPQPHFVNTDVRIYRFKEGMKDAADPNASSSTLLVVWAPDAPSQPANPDGSVLGYG